MSIHELSGWPSQLHIGVYHITGSPCIVLPPWYCLLNEKAICIEILTYQFIKYVLKLRSMCLCDPLEVTASVYRSNYHCRVVYLRTLIFL